MLTQETKEYIEAQYESGAWTPIPDYLGTFCIIPPDDSAPFAVHKSLKQPGMIAFYESVAKAEAQRETITKVGRFLTRFRPELGQDEIRKLAERYQAEQAQSVLTFATTEDEIEEVYVNGPHSCMAGGASKFDSSIHPARVYAAGDLAVAHIGMESRVLCWPEKKIYGRIYGNTEAQRIRLEDALGDAGYSYKPYKFYGAKLLLVEDEDSHVMPYLDNGLEVEERDGYFIIVRDGIAADSQNGLLSTKECSVCGNGIGNSDEYGDMCESCYDEHSYCSNCGELTHHNNITYLEGPDLTLCHHCLSTDYTRCESCDEYVKDQNILEVISGTNRTKSYCSECVSDHATSCASCDEYVLKDNALRADCGESFCCTNCKEEHDTSCLDCEESRETLSVGDTSDNLDMFNPDKSICEAILARELETVT